MGGTTLTGLQVLVDATAIRCEADPPGKTPYGPARYRTYSAWIVLKIGDQAIRFERPEFSFHSTREWAIEAATIWLNQNAIQSVNL